MRARIGAAGQWLPSLVSYAREVLAGEPEAVIKTSVLQAWSGLAAVRGWDAGMVRAVERELARRNDG